MNLVLAAAFASTSTALDRNPTSIEIVIVHRYDDGNSFYFTVANNSNVQMVFRSDRI
jgi:hypothetical protein